MPPCLERPENANPKQFRMLNRIQAELDGGGAADVGFELLGSNVNLCEGTVDVYVVLGRSDAKRALAERYGAGSVRVWSALEQVR